MSWTMFRGTTCTNCPEASISIWRPKDQTRKYTNKVFTEVFWHRRFWLRPTWFSESPLSETYPGTTTPPHPLPTQSTEVLTPRLKWSSLRDRVSHSNVQVRTSRCGPSSTKYKRGPSSLERPHPECLILIFFVSILIRHNLKRFP